MAPSSWPLRPQGHCWWPEIPFSLWWPLTFELHFIIVGAGSSCSRPIEEIFRRCLTLQCYKAVGSSPRLKGFLGGTKLQVRGLNANQVGLLKSHGDGMWTMCVSLGIHNVTCLQRNRSKHMLNLRNHVFLGTRFEDNYKAKVCLKLPAPVLKCAKCVDTEKYAKIRCAISTLKTVQKLSLELWTLHTRTPYWRRNESGLIALAC